MKYSCLRCGLDFKQKCHFIDHLNRKNICLPILEPMSIEEIKKYYNIDLNQKLPPKSTEIHQNSTKIHQNPPNLPPNISTKIHQNPPKFSESSTKIHQNPPKSGIVNECPYCYKRFTRSDSLNRHYGRCKEIKKYKENQDKDEEIKELKQMVKQLITNQNSVGGSNSCNNSNNVNTTNNNDYSNNSYNMTNSNNDNSMNIHINNYGCENKDYITKDYLIELLKSPFEAIPKLIEYTHFNKEHPENQNIKLPNKKQPYIKVLKDDKWIYADRKSTILDLIDEKHCELNDGPLKKHVDKNFSMDLQDRFERFNERYLNDEKEFANQLYKETELVIINNS